MAAPRLQGEDVIHGHVEVGSTLKIKDNIQLNCDGIQTVTCKWREAWASER